MSTLRRSSSSYGGFADGIVLRGMPLLTLYPGNVYWVDSGGGGGSKGTFAHPVATIVEGLALCTASNGDIIVVKPGHAETITTTLSMNKNGVAIVGLGSGSLMPTFTGTGATDDLDVAADNMAFVNLQFKHTTAAATAMINIGAEWCTISGCRFEQSLYSEECIVVEYDKDDLTIADCEFVVTANGPNGCINIEKSTTASPARIKILRNHFDGMNATNAWDTGVIETDGVATNMLIKDNIFQYMIASKGGVELTAASTGIMADNLFGGGTLGQMIDPGALMCFNNRESDAVDQSGMIFPATTAA